MMKNLKYILLAILLGLNLVACEAPPIQDEVGLEIVEKDGPLTEDEDDEQTTKD